MTKTGFHHIPESFGTLKQFKIAKNRFLKAFFTNSKTFIHISKPLLEIFFPTD